MRKLITASIFVAMMFLCVFSRLSFAQSGTLVVYASQGPLDKIIGADTTNSGLQKHSEYQLVSTDTTYIFDATMTFKSAVSIIGVPNPTTGALPTIQPDVLSNGSVPGAFFQFSGKGTRNNVSNLYFLGLSVQNTVGYGVGISILADSITINASNLVFDDITGDAFSYQSNWDNLFITNCTMRNSINSVSDYYEGEFIRDQNWVGSWQTDSIVVKNCTLNCIAAYMAAVTTPIIKYFEVSHCDIINTVKNPFFIDRAVNAKIDNNLFYNAYALGMNYTEYSGGWDSFTPYTVPSLINFGPLDSASAAMLLGHARNGASDSLAAEAMRVIEVENNVYYYSPALTSFYHSWNDTAHAAVGFDSVYTPVFMNPQTAAMFNNSSVWPGFHQSGNQNVDPGFGPSIDASLTGGTGFGDGLLGYFTAVRGGKGTTQTYGCHITVVPQPIPANYMPAWPLPEAADLKYSNSALMTAATDGKPVGDLYWFYGVADGIESLPSGVPAKFELANNYPNPFNPSTTISFTVAQNGPTSLNIYNVLGQLVMTVYQGMAQAHVRYTYNVSLDNFASGVYFYSLRQGANVITKKMLLMK
jgi:hypothetical protein